MPKKKSSPAAKKSSALAELGLDEWAAKASQNLTSKQLKTLTVWDPTLPFSEIARRAGVARFSIQGWLKQADFKQAVDELVAMQIQAATLQADTATERATAAYVDSVATEAEAARLEREGIDPFTGEPLPEGAVLASKRPPLWASRQLLEGRGIFRQHREERIADDDPRRQAWESFCAQFPESPNGRPRGVEEVQEDERPALPDGLVVGMGTARGDAKRNGSSGNGSNGVAPKAGKRKARSSRNGDQVGEE